MRLSDHFAVPSSVGGYLEWASGILFVNATHEHFNGLIKTKAGKRSDADARLLQTITHENYHFLQMTTTGYLYQFACLLFEAVEKIVKPPVDQARLEELLANPPPPSESLLWLAQELDAPGPEGITVRSIVESAAFLYEHKTHYSGLTASSYAQLLAGVKNHPEYRHAYEVAHRWLGPAAFDNYLIASIISLCFDRPPDAFIEVLKEMKLSGAVYSGPRDLQRLLSVAPKVASRHRPLGSSVEYAFGDDWPSELKQHPVYAPAVLALNEEANVRSPILIAVDPGAVNAESAVSMVRPILFQSGALYVPDAFRKRLPGSSADVQLQVIGLLGAIAMQILSKRVTIARYRTD